MRPLIVLALFAGVAAADPLDVEWRVYPMPDPSSIDGSKQPVELVATVGAATQRVKLPAQLGQLPPRYQTACRGKLPRGEDVVSPLRAGELAAIAFEEGGTGGYLLRRSGDRLAVIAWSQDDGACPGRRDEPVACPRHDRVVTELRVPAFASIREHIALVDAKGGRRAFACAGD
ncbi:MAG TPA: hypothetical protein VLX92_27455 [Kofleriaceae bacterium]|nr:hypothetical protein [Kofleriaceae bacterium]